jgi:hypothetical protein
MQQGNKRIIPKSIPLPEFASDQIENGKREQSPAKSNGATNITIVRAK